MHDRFSIEKSILGGVICCDGYTQVAHILSAANFSTGNTRHQELYRLAQGLYPDKPIDLVSVMHQAHLQYPEDNAIIDSLIKIADVKVSVTSSLPYWAFILLQIDISEKFKKELVEWRSNRMREMDHAESGALQEIIEGIVPGQDIFELLDAAKGYFDHLKMEHELQQTQSFYDDLSIKVRKVKSLYSINTALSYIFKMGEYSPQIRHECQVFANAIAEMITTRTMNPIYKQAANLIKPTNHE